MPCLCLDTLLLGGLEGIRLRLELGSRHTELNKLVEGLGEAEGKQKVG